MRRIGVDIGGTFTDFVLEDSITGEYRFDKKLTTSGDPTIGVLEGLDSLVGKAMDLRDVDLVIHATTLATNAVLQRRGARTALITTRGFRDVLQIQRQRRHELYNLFESKPPALVPRRDTWELAERVDARGQVVVPIDIRQVHATARDVLRRDYDAVAVCLLHSYANPTHEQAVRAIFDELDPTLPVSLSSDVSPVVREYERTNTTVVNAYILPAVRRYLHKMTEQLRRRGYARELYLLHSNGGMIKSAIASQYPVRIIESGPAAGVVMASRIAEESGFSDAISFDMGGTTAKVCVIREMTPTVSQMFEIDRSKARAGSGLPISVSAIDLIEIGRGGGSIASVSDGLLSVGPASAGSDPGPACYGRGGAKPTVTDANLLLGYLNPEYFLEGRMALDAEAAADAVRSDVGAPLGLDEITAAWGIHALVNSNMERATRLLTIEQGLDTRAMVLVAFGGSGPLHAARIARDLGISTVLIPIGAGVTAARGLLEADLTFDLAHTRSTVIDSGPADIEIQETLASMESRAKEMLAEAGLPGDDTFRWSVDCRYAGQGHELNVAFGGHPSSTQFLSEVRDGFERAYMDAYGFVEEAHIAEAVTWRVQAVRQLRRDRTATKKRPIALVPLAPDQRLAYMPERGGMVECQVFRRSSMTSGTIVTGPALFEEPDTTVVIPPDAFVTLDPRGNLLIHVPNRT